KSFTYRHGHLLGIKACGKTVEEPLEVAYGNLPGHSEMKLFSRILCKWQARSTHGKDRDSSSDVCSEDVISGSPNRLAHSGGSLVHSAPSAFQKHSLSSVLNRSSLRERFNSGWPPPANGDEIHKRVKNILRTHSARQRLNGRALVSPPHISMKRKGVYQYSPVQQNITVHLDNGEFWYNRAAVYKGKPHRAIFEDSLGKIYRNMYQKASGTISDQKAHS
uniref:Uncharacterized protein n=1 Tax=Meleagris gallopavo TaxID=9103 RepID=A0A803Y7G6_MELGA